MNTRFTMAVAVYLLLFDEDKVLLARRMNTGYEDGNFSLPAGHVEANETALAAMVREAREEIGILIQPDDLVLVHTLHRNAHREYIDLFFTCKKWQGTPSIQEPDKCDELQWSALQSLPENTIEYLRQVFACVKRNEPYSEFGW